MNTSGVEAEVRLNGRAVGTLAYDRGGSTFRYTDALSSPGHRVLGQIFEDDPRTPRRARVGLPAWFANLLPEGELRRHVEREMGGGPVNDFKLRRPVRRPWRGLALMAHTAAQEVPTWLWCSSYSP